MSSEASSSSPPPVISQPTQRLTLADVTQLIDTHADLNAFYAGLHARAAATTSVLTSLTVLPSIHFRLNDLKKRDPERKLPLHAVPFIAKDNIDAPPHPTTAGCPVFSHIPSAPAFVISQLEELGAVMLGKANLDQFACGLVGTRSQYGMPNNPHNNAYIPGGSSSGSAVAVALGLCVFSLGTDTAGSGRVPAAMNGIVGLKPTKGLVSTTGVVPAAQSQDCVSVFANSVEDSARILALLSRQTDDLNPFHRRPPADKLLTTDAVDSDLWKRVDFTFGVPQEEHLEFNGDSVSEESFRRSVEELEKIGGQKVEIDYQPFGEVAKMLYGSALLSERFAAVGSFFRDHALNAPSGFDPYVLRIILSGNEGQRGHDVFKAQLRVRELTHVAKRETWCKVDVLVVPTIPRPVTVQQVQAKPMELNSMLGTYTNFVNLMDYCAVAVPAVEVIDETRVPRGVTIIGQAFEEKIIVDIARKFEDRVAREAVGA